MNRTELIGQIEKKGTFLCIGLDPDPLKMPEKLRNDPQQVLDFCAAIIEKTSSLCAAYKLNIAFFEALGREGWNILFETRKLIPQHCFTIADAKRADIGNSARQYAIAFFDQLDFDAITVAPYMGSDSVKPFLEFPDKWTILLALTSNTGASDFQFFEDQSGQALYEQVIRTSQTWGNPENLMYVTGATQTSYLRRIREIAPDHFLLVPGVGAQGGSLEEVVTSCMTSTCGLLVNSSREIIYASSADDFAEKAAERAHRYQVEMRQYLLSR